MKMRKRAPIILCGLICLSGCTAAPDVPVAEGWVAPTEGVAIQTVLQRDLALASGFEPGPGLEGRNDATQGGISGAAPVYLDRAYVDYLSDQHSHFGRIHDHTRIRTRVRRRPEIR